MTNTDMDVSGLGVDSAGKLTMGGSELVEGGVN